MVIKLGGDMVKGEFPPELLSDIKALSAANQLILVHGGGDVVTEIATKLGKEQKFVVSPDGIRSRYTDRETMDIFTMVMCGMIAKKLLETLARNGIRAVSLSGLDGGVLRATRKKKLLIVDERARKVVIDGGYTGKMQSADGTVIDALLEKGFIPVVSPVAMGDEAEPLNVDSDRAAAYLAMGSQADAVLFLTDVKGLTLDGNVVERPDRRAGEGLRCPKIGFGMQKKILAGIEAMEGGVREVIIASGFGPAPSHGRHGTRGLHGDKLMMNIMEAEELHGPQTYQKFPVVIVRGSGAEVWDDAGQRVRRLHGRIRGSDRRALQPRGRGRDQEPGGDASSPATARSTTTPAATFFEKLTSCTPKGLDAAFLSNSGAEANEVAIKLAKKFTGKKGLIAMKGGVPREDRRRPLGHLEQEVQGALRAAPPVLQARRVREPRRARGGDRTRTRRRSCSSRSRAKAGSSSPRRTT